ncbi:MAG: hypothetical protein E7279_01370 [Lachnospiraceae bacterium]|nr:hypothetical protein [Lachnospiraceae bacterium]
MEYTIKTDKELPFWIGDKFYKVGRPFTNAEVRFNATCPCCQNKRTIKAKGVNGTEYEVDCPVCVDNKKTYYFQSAMDSISVTNWEVHEYIVHEAALQNEAVVSSIKKDFAISIVLMAFHKYGRCKGDYIKEQIPIYKTNYIDANLDDLASEVEKIFEYRRVSEYMFRNKKDAKKFLQLVKDYDRKRLEEFNHKFNTTHEYPY